MTPPRRPDVIRKPCDVGLAFDPVRMVPHALTVRVAMLYDPKDAGKVPDYTFNLLAWRAVYRESGGAAVQVAPPASVRLEPHALAKEVTFTFPPLPRDLPGRYRFFCVADCADEVPELPAGQGANNIRQYPTTGYGVWPQP